MLVTPILKSISALKKSQQKHFSKSDRAGWSPARFGQPKCSPKDAADTYPYCLVV